MCCRYQLSFAIGDPYGRIYESLHEMVLVISLLLPGTAIVYYGDEIGMNGAANEIAFEHTRDPYALPPYANETDYYLKSRDPNRTPMQVRMKKLFLKIP